MHRFAVAGALALFLTPAAQAQSGASGTARAVSDAGGVSGAIDTLEIRAHTRFLADDLLAGRGTGTPGERMAAAYIESQLLRLGLEPLGDDGSFLLPVPLRVARVEPGSSATVNDGRAAATFENGVDFIVNTGGAGAFRDFSGRALFVGQPVHAGALIGRADHFAGAVAVFLGPLGEHAIGIVPALEAAGAAGMVILVPDSTQFDLYARSRGRSRYFVDADVDEPVWQQSLPAIIAGPDLADALINATGLPPAWFDGTATEPLDLQRTVDVRIRTTIRDVPSANIGALLPGSDPTLRDEYVVFTAHYDHLGISTPDASGDSIYNGFSDNAAGTAMLLAIAASLRDAPPARSVAFLFFSGEERGLLGSTYMASAPPLPLDRIAGLINLDAGAPPAPPLNWRIAGAIPAPGAEPNTAGAAARAVAERHGWTVNLSTASPNSDYWPFLRQGVPSIFIIPGDRWEDTTPEERDALRRRWDRYHMADDHWHPDFPFAGLGRYAEFARLLGLEIAGR